MMKVLIGHANHYWVSSSISTTILSTVEVPKCKIQLFMKSASQSET